MVALKWTDFPEAQAVPQGAGLPAGTLPCRREWHAGRTSGTGQARRTGQTSPTGQRSPKARRGERCTRAQRGPPAKPDVIWPVPGQRILPGAAFRR